MSTKYIIIFCTMIITISLWYIGSKISISKYDFYVQGNLAYILNKTNGNIEILPVGIGMDDYVPHTVINKKTWSSYTSMSLGHISTVEKMSKTTENNIEELINKMKKFGYSDEEISKIVSSMQK